jgi:hypothetical protein
MEFTKAGTEVVQSVEFARALGKFLSELHPGGETNESDVKTAILMIAWVATGRDLNQPPVGAELAQLTDFIESNEKELTALAGKILTKLAGYHLGANVN